MRYALVNGIKREALKGARGKCLCCEKDVIAKCGKFRCNHWAHKNTKPCLYSQKEHKTAWHIRWQNCFPEDWQEFRCKNEQTGDIHIADIRTPNGLVVEFQHSAITPDERFSRERYHKNMIWVVDGIKRKSYFKNFFKNFNYWEQIHEETQNQPFSIYDTGFIYKRVPEDWLLAATTVYFDFRSNDIDSTWCEQERLWHNLIWGFVKINHQYFTISMTYNYFIDYVKNDKICVNINLENNAITNNVSKSSLLLPEKIQALILAYIGM